MNGVKRWYVFDMHDCINSFDSAVEAAAYAQEMVDEFFDGVHIAYMSDREFAEYCVTGRFPFAVA